MEGRNFGNTPEGQEFEEKRQLELKALSLRFAYLFDLLLKRHNDRSGVSLKKYINENTFGEILPRVIDTWLAGTVPSLGICRDVVAVLDELEKNPDRLPIIPSDPKDALVFAPESSDVPLVSKHEKNSRPTRQEIMDGDDELAKRMVQAARKREKDSKERKKAQRQQRIDEYRLKQFTEGLEREKEQREGKKPKE